MVVRPPDQVDREKWRGAPISARLGAFGQVFIAHPTLATVIEAVRWRYQLLKDGGDPRGIMVLAPPDGGKTTLMEHLAKGLPPSEVREQLPDGSYIDRTEIPCVCITSPTPCNLVGTANAILLSLNSPLAFGRQPKKQYDDAINQLKLAKTKLLIIDNAHDIPEQRGPVGQYHILSFIRDIVEKARIIVVMLGTDITETILLSNPQLHKRIPAPLRLGFYDVSTEVGLARCLRMLDALDDVLPFAEKSNLGSGALGYGLACAGDGRIGTCCTLLTGAFSYAIASGREHIVLEDVRKSYKQIYLDYAATVDPFAEGFKPRRLILPDEPHFQFVPPARGRPRKSVS